MAHLCRVIDVLVFYAHIPLLTYSSFVFLVIFAIGMRDSIISTISLLKIKNLFYSSSRAIPWRKITKHVVSAYTVVRTKRVEVESAEFFDGVARPSVGE